MTSNETLFFTPCAKCQTSYDGADKEGQCGALMCNAWMTLLMQNYGRKRIKRYTAPGTTTEEMTRILDISISRIPQ